MEHRNLRSLLSVQARALFGTDLTETQIGQFMTYLDELLAWNQTTNLTSITDEEAVVVKHFVDSIAGLRAQRFMPGARVLDVGSGAGFPGIPLKIVRPDCPMTLVEPSKKKSSFLHFMVGALKLANTRVVTSTLEEFAADEENRQRYNYVVTRALKYAGVLAKARELLAETGRVILYLSNSLDANDIPQSWALDSEFAFDLPHGGGRRVLSVLYPAA